jgi:hypothetical protein
MPGNAGVNLCAQLSDLPVVPGHAPWPGHEYVRGWGIFGLPFDSGHVLALRVFPENDFGPYRTVWHRDPGGRWSIYVDGPRLDAACPRYYGAAQLAEARSWYTKAAEAGHAGARDALERHGND